MSKNCSHPQNILPENENGLSKNLYMKSHIVENWIAQVLYSADALWKMQFVSATVIFYHKRNSSFFNQLISFILKKTNFPQLNKSLLREYLKGSSLHLWQDASLPNDLHVVKNPCWRNNSDFFRGHLSVIYQISNNHSKAPRKNACLENSSETLHVPIFPEKTGN